MSTIPENQVTQADLDTWFVMNQQLAKLKASEMLLRMKIFNGLFTAPREGTNKHGLGSGWQLTAVYPIDRKIDAALLSSLAPSLREEYKIVLETVIKNKPELSVSAYKSLSEEQRKALDQCITAKPGSPQLKLEQPKRAAAAGFVAPDAV
jgi:hypothetical protein